MTQEEKAKAYDEAIERAKNFIENGDERERTIAESIFAGLVEESEDERIRKGIISGMKALQEKNKCTRFANIPMNDVLAWLEKQGEHVNKVESNFKVGEWYVDKQDGTILQITKVLGKTYKYITNTGEEHYCAHCCLEQDTHLWNIQDAKPGDVLSDGTTIFIFKDLLSDGSVMSYCDYDTDSGESDAFCSSSVNLICSKITPVIKEQRDFLFQKMKEAGYEWDAKKKELKNIIDEKQIKKNLQDNSFRRMFEQNFSWSKEDDNCLSTIIAEFSKCAGKSVSKDEWMRCNDFLNSIRDKVQPKQEWSEDDDKKRKGLIKGLEDRMGFGWASDPFSREEYIDWLKSLREK